MATLHLRAKSLQRAELQLFDGSFGLFKAIGDFADGALVDETLVNDAALCGGKFVDQPKELHLMVDSFEVARRQVLVRGGFWRIVRQGMLARGPLVLIGEGVGGNAEEPRGEGCATPFVVGKIGEGFVKDF